MRRPMPAVSQSRTDTFTEHRWSDGLSDILRGGEGVSPALSPIRSFAEQPVLIGYMRVSKADGSQTLDLQRDALLAAGVEPEHLYEDQASGKRDNRPGLEACLKALRQGDTLVAWKLDRLGRDLRHLVNLVHDVTRREIGRPSSPRWELDIVAYSGRDNLLLVLECKSRLDSQGVNPNRPFKIEKVPAKIAAPLAAVSALRKPRLPKRRLPGPRNRASRAPRHRRETRRAGAGTGRAPQQSGLRRKKP